MKRDKKRIEGEPWSAEQLQLYLDFNTYDGTDRDFHCLYRAYTRMDETAFLQFVALFKSEGRNLAATNPDGHTLAALLANHAQSEFYLGALV
ncbi:PA4642 family protein [Reinekea forsetii]|jgi:hypothetical protein|uniref:Uncharacterized protein n=1 Tax=Reinekea forsetii TaxID=1336806 RepID=A0A2K8KWV1_9GAMM|nr:PA4642 family protein [Reinekea forsetii]ATX78131.1 hypothetical protein REIFOR_03012 [Reinekea forsetii]